MKKSKLIQIFSLLTLLSCSPRNDEIHMGGSTGLVLKRSETLRFPLPNEPTSFDWSKTGDQQASWLQSLIMEGLTGWDYSGDQPTIKPSLATHWKTKNNNLIWTFYLRKDVLWSDGVRFKAQHAYDGIIRTLTPSTGAMDASFLYPIKNAEKFNQGSVSDVSQVGVKIVGDNEIQFTLEKPLSFFPMRLATTPSYPVRLDLIAQRGAAWTQPGKIVTLGPYSLEKWKSNHFLLLVRNKMYWGEPAKIKNVILQIIENPKTQINLFKRGVLDFANILPLTEIAGLKNLPGYMEKKSLRTSYLAFNLRKPPFNNKKLRQAFAMAICKKEIIQAIDHSHESIESFYSPSITIFRLDLKSLCSPDSAKKMFQDSMTRDDQKKVPILLGFNTSDLNKRLVENLQFQLKKNLGLNMQTEHQEWKTFLQRINSDDSYHIFLMGWGGIEVDPHNFMVILKTGNPQNKSGWSNKQYDQLIEVALSENDLEKRKKLYEKAMNIIRDEVPVIPLISHTYRAIVSDRLNNVKLNSMGREPIYRWEFKEN